MAFDLGNLLQQYLSAGQTAPSGEVEQHFDEVSRQLPRDELGSGVAEALRSDQTPPFSEMVGQLFGNSDPQQRAGMLNQLIAGLGPGLLGGLGGGLAGLLGGTGGQAASITAEQASRMEPNDVQQIAERAQQNDPSIIDRMGNFYAENPTLVKTLGGAALAIIMSKMAQRNNI